ncbi:hypothetical protein HDU93_001470 [Gonapodya sp. JEL0774]|nr:hypothetical protein HDU93_001470 [Gonapodya sp. JEL0774]
MPSVKERGMQRSVTTLFNASNKSSAKSKTSTKRQSSSKVYSFDSTPWDSLSYAQLVAISRPAPPPSGGKKPRHLSISASKPVILPTPEVLEEARRRKEEDEARIAKIKATERCGRHRARGADFFRAGKHAAALVEYMHAIEACTGGTKTAEEQGSIGLRKSQSLDLAKITRSPSGLTYNTSSSTHTDQYDLLPPRVSTVLIPIDPVLFTNAALCHARLGDHSAAVQCTTRALEVDPSCLKTWWIRAHAKRSMWHLEDALADAEMCGYLLEQWTQDRIYEQVTKELVGVPEAAEAFNEHSITNRGLASSPDPMSPTTPTSPTGRAPSPAFSKFGFTQYDVRRLISSLRTAISDSQKNIEIISTVSAHDTKKLETLLNLLTSLLVRCQPADPAHCERASAALAQHVGSDPRFSVAFRAFGGFDRLLTLPLFNSVTAPHILPVILAALGDSTNTRELGRYAGQLTGILRGEAFKSYDITTSAMIAKVVARAVKESSFLEAVGDLNREQLSVVQ